MRIADELKEIGELNRRINPTTFPDVNVLGKYNLLYHKIKSKHDIYEI